MSEQFYRAFEDRYRGSRETIKARLMAYQPFFAPLVALYPQGIALDLGCGRGEWLELLGEHGFDAHGVDLDDGMLAACRERGLKGELADALSALRARADASLAMVSAFHLIEHIPFDQVQLLIAEARRALKPGGLLIMETPNPENLIVGASSFYMDPSHIKPLPPALVDFAVGHAGFARHKVLRLQEPAHLHHDGPIGLMDVLDGVSPDYAVIGQSAAPPEIAERFGAAFDTTFGITLPDLGQRYEQQAETRRSELHLALQNVTRRVERNELSTQASLDTLHKGVARVADGVENNRLQLEPLLQKSGENAHRIGELQGQLIQQTQMALQAQLAHQDYQNQSAGQLGELAHRIGLAEARSHEAEHRVAEAQQHIAALLSSSSWRVTAPLRLAASLVYRTRSALREGRVGSGLRRRTKGSLLALMRAALRRPRVKRLALALLRRVPALHARLYGVLRQGHAPAPQAAPSPAPSSSVNDLSPRALQCYHDLKQAIDARNK